MPWSLTSTISNELSSVADTTVNDPLVQFYSYQSRSDIKAWKEQYIKSTCPNFERWKGTLDTICICKRSEYGSLQLSTHFKVSDYCKGSGETLLFSMKTIQILETIWNYFGKDVYISSGYRDPAYNRRVGGANGSMHMWGLAVDMKVHGLTAQIVGEFIAHYFEGCEIGVYGHSDMRNSGNWVHVAPRNGYSDYNHRITGSTEFKKYRAQGAPEDPVIYTDGSFEFGYNSTSGGVAPSIDYTKINPYIITVDRNSDDVDYEKLKETCNIIGVMVEAGYLFTPTHSEVSVFKSPKLEEQIAAITKANLPFGLYMTARARTDDDARKEVRDFSYIYRKYSPGFGIWLELDLGLNVETNNKLIETYYSLFYKHGFKDRMGFYVTEKQLEQIDWEKYQNDWYLWIVKHVEDVNSLDALLDPMFFDMDGENPLADWTQVSWNSFGSGSDGGGSLAANEMEAAKKFINCIKENGASAKSNSQLYSWVCSQYPPAKGFPRGWCAATMQAAAIYCGYAGKIFPDSNMSADPDVGFAAQIYKSYGGKRIDAVTGTPQIGDIFQIPPGKLHRHVGVVSALLGDGKVETVEGNNAGVKTRQTSQFSYYARPDWSKVVTSNSSTKSSDIKDTVDSSISSAVDAVVNKV